MRSCSTGKKREERRSSVTEGFKFKRAIWQIFSPKLNTVETNYPLVLRETGAYAHEMIAALVDIEDFIEHYIPDGTEGKAAFLRNIQAIDSKYMPIGDLLTMDPGTLGDDRRGRAVFISHVRQHVNTIRVFAKESGMGDGESKEEERGGNLVIKEVTPSIFIEPWIMRRLDPSVEENAILLFLGSTGAGKSLSSISLAMSISEQTGQPFKLENIVFAIEDVLDLVYHREPPLPRGSCIIFDDAGANANARDWRSQANTILAKMAQTFRYRGILFIMTVPDISFIDIQVRKSVHAKLVSVINERGENEKGTFCLTVNKQDDEGNIDFGPPILAPEDFGSDTPFKLDPSNILIESFHFPLPPEEISGPYKEMKNRYLSKQIVDLESAMDMDQKLDEMRRKALYEKYSKMIEDQGEWNEISQLRKQAAREKAKAEIRKASETTKKLSRQEQIDEIIITRTRAGESVRMISEVISASIQEYSRSMVQKRKAALKDKGMI